MGTNYFLHLGKRSADRQDGRCTLTTAVHLRLADHMKPEARVIEDEYGNRFTLAEFDELTKRDVLDHTHVGEEFS